MKDQFYKNQQYIDERFNNTLQSGDHQLVKDFLDRCEVPPSDLVSLVLKQQQESLIDIITEVIPVRFFRTKNSQWVEPWIQLNKYLADFKDDIQGAYNVVDHILHNIPKAFDKNRLSEKVSEAMGYFYRMVALYNLEYQCHPKIKSIFDASFLGLCNFLFYNASEIEFRYIIKCIRSEVQSGSIPRGVKIEKLCLTDYDEYEIENQKYEILRAKTIVSTNNAEHFLNEEYVREVCMEKVRMGDNDISLMLGLYYYETKDYDKAFPLLIKTRGWISRDRFNTYMGIMYLGLMYFYGRGVERDYEKAQLLLEEVLESEVLGDKEIEAYYVLGQIYEITVGWKKAIDIYTMVLERYKDCDNPILKDISKSYMDILCFSSIHDTIKFNVKITPKNLKCEFALELPTFCKFIINYGDSRKGECKLTVGTIKNNGILKLKHKYKIPGEYEITVSTLPAKTLLGFEFIKYKYQLQSIEFTRVPAIKKINVAGQRLKKLRLPDSPLLIGLICRNNNIKSLDLRKHPQLQYLDCSYNPLTSLKVSPRTALNKACLNGTNVDRAEINKILALNVGKYCKPLYYTDIIELDMPLEFYFRMTNWKGVKEYFRIDESFDYYRDKMNFKELEIVFNCLKELANKRNKTPYSKGHLDIYDTFVIDKTIIGAEEFFITEKEWTICLATKVHDARFNEPWMGMEAPSPEYFVSNCLFYMANNKSEMEKYIYRGS